ncbi:MAG: hypothetical protein FRX49_12959 [Trebouxia sp. A1-2]|nr:MAG: hypothetical protein FRX49_12959 [Trebouxia sp. A1-2]
MLKSQIQNVGTHQGVLAQASGRAAGGWGVLTVNADCCGRKAVEAELFPKAEGKYDRHTWPLWQQLGQTLGQPSLQ